MNAYERLEQLGVLALSLIIAGTILMALFQLYRRVIPLLIGGAIFTVLIAMEFKHSIVRAALRRDSIVHAPSCSLRCLR